MDSFMKSQLRLSLHSARDLLSQASEAVGMLKVFERAKTSNGPLKRTNHVNTIASSPDLELMGITAIEVNPDGEIVQVERIVEDGEK